MEPLPAPWLYFIIAEYSCQSCWAILQYVCLDGKRSVLRLTTPAIRFYWEVLRSAHACLFSFVRKRETACDILRFYSARVGIAVREFSNAARLSGLLSSLLDYAFLCGDPDGATESTARQSTFLRKPLGFAVFSAGSTLGLRAPDCAKESSTLWTLFMWFAAESLFAKPRNNCHHRIAAPTLRNTRVHGETRPALIYGRTGRAVYRRYLLAQSSRLEPPPSGEESGCSARSGVEAAQPSGCSARSGEEAAQPSGTARACVTQLSR